MRHSDTVHRAAAMFPCGDRPDRFPIRTRVFRRLRYCTGHSAVQLRHGSSSHEFFRIVFKAAPICIFFMLVLLLIYLWQFCTGKKLDKSILVYGKTGQQEILGI
mgnify:CR=1 FL=1